jgi:hypothetical protein
MATAEILKLQAKAKPAYLHPFQICSFKRRFSGAYCQLQDAGHRQKTYCSLDFEESGHW